MKNFKIGFSMLVAILVLSVVTSAFAASKPAKTAGIGIKAIDKDTVTVAANVAGNVYSAGSVLDAETGWVITLKKASDNSTVGTVDTTVNYASFDVVEGASYYAVVVAKNATGSADPFTSATFKFEYKLLLENTEFNKSYLDPATGKVRADVVKDNEKSNANNTGEGGMAKGISGHKTHGDYKNNTNSCASCHQTHTAAGKNLLFKETAEEACIACHDGTGMTIYNVFPTSMALDNGSGTFAGTTGGNMSVHLTDESVELSAAPGSNLAIKGATWTGEFSCDTCHNPHGSYSSRLLQTNTAGFMNVERTYVGVTAAPVAADYVAPKQWYGGLFKTVSIVDATADAGQLATTEFDVAGIANNSVWAKTVTLNGKPATVSSAPGQIGSVTGSSPNQKYTISNFGAFGDAAIALQPGKELLLAQYKVTAADIAVGGYYEKTGLAVNQIIWQFVKKLDGGAFWQRVPFNTVSNFKPDFTASSVTGYTSLNNIKGYFVPKAGEAPTAITNFRAFQIVRLPQVATAATVVNGVQEMKTPWNSSNLVTSASTVAYAQYCGTCHVDYASGSGLGTDLDNGKKAYHHTANSTSAGRSCAFCHYAHGTDVTFMRDAVGNTVESLSTVGDIASPVTPTPMTVTDAKIYMLDKNPSSALKRYTNMAVCYGCHISSHYAGLGNNGQTGPGSSAGLGNNGLLDTSKGINGIWK